MRQWLDVCETEGGILVAQQLLHKRPLLVAQMVEEWLNHYRRLAYVFFKFIFICLDGFRLAFLYTTDITIVLKQLCTIKIQVSCVEF